MVLIFYKRKLLFGKLRCSIKIIAFRKILGSRTHLNSLITSTEL